jgi:xylulokinase
MYLGLDLGTTNVKAVVASAWGKILGQVSKPVRLFHVGLGGVEQDIEEIWNAVVSATREATRGVRRNKIRAVGVSSQGGALQVLDRNGRPKSRVVSWLDQRGRPFNRRLTEELGQNWFAERIGHRGAGLAIGQLLRLKPKNRLGFVGDVIVGRLCGRAAQDGTSAALTLLYNPALRRYDPDVLERLGISSEQLPDLISPRIAAGKLSKPAAHANGLPEGIPVSAAIHDQYAAALGTGAARAGITMLGAGTAWVLLAVSDQRRDLVVENAFVCHHVLDGERRTQNEQARRKSELWGQIVSLVNGGSSLTWTLELMGLGKSSAAKIETLLNNAPAGSNGVIFWPFMARAGGEGLTPETKGRLSGLQLSHKHEHVARAVVEGLAFELRRHLLFLKRGRVPVRKLVMGGTVAASRITTQIIADVTGLPLICVDKGSGSALGAAILARGLIETDRPLASLSEEMRPQARAVYPGTDRQLYAVRFQDYIAGL